MKKKKYSWEVTISTTQLFSLLVCAGRYAWSRSSTAPGSIADIIKQYGSRLRRGELQVLYRDVQEELAERKKRPVDACNAACDINTLESLQKWLAERIDDPETANDDGTYSA